MPIGHIGIVLLLSALPLHFMEATEASAFSYGRADVGLVQTIRLQQAADDLRRRLEILERVDVAVVPHNPLVMSVETLAGRSGPFIITADIEFISGLTEEELRAAVAHELGHVWIYTHHPYIQTEKLANDVALRVTSSDVLVPVYEKVWKRMGVRGNLAEYITFDAKSGGQ